MLLRKIKFSVWQNQSLLGSPLFLPNIQSKCADAILVNVWMERTTSGPKHKPNRNVYLYFAAHELAGGQARRRGSVQTYQAH